MSESAKKILAWELLLLIVVLMPACFFPERREILKARSISNFTLDGNALYFGAGYHLYRVDLASRAIDRIYSTDRIRVEQPVVSDGVAYFGGISFVNKGGGRGEDQGLFAVDIQSRQKFWKFPLGVGGYGTFGTYPVIVEDRILVCARQHLHCLSRKTGEELWKVNNWLGQDSDGTTVPYAYDGSVYFKIAEEYFTRDDSNDGNWARLSLNNGKRAEVLVLADQPGTYHDMNGNGLGILADGVVYGATRYDRTAYPASRFGALDLKAKKFLWEVNGSTVRTKPALSTRYVFTFGNNSVEALDRKTGAVAWSKELGEIVQSDLERSNHVGKWGYEMRRSRRLAANEDMVIVQGSQGIMARRSNDGGLLWLVKMKSEDGDADPIIIGSMAIVSSVAESAIIAIDLVNALELWRVSIPDCEYHYILDD